MINYWFSGRNFRRAKENFKRIFWISIRRILIFISNWMINACRKQQFEKILMVGFVFNIERLIHINGLLYILSKVMTSSKIDRLSLSLNVSLCLIRTTILLPTVILQLRVIQDSPIQNRSPWSIQQFYLFYIHSSLQWLSWKDQWNSTFLILINQSNNETFYETKDVYFHSNSILQIEFNDTNFRDNPIEYSADLGLTWSEISNENQLKFSPIKFHQKNITIYRLTIELNLFSTIRFRFKQSHIHYAYLGSRCPMNCYGLTRCMNGECQSINQPAPLVCKHPIFVG